MWILSPVKWVGRGFQWLLVGIATNIVAWGTGIALVALVGWFGYQQLPEETKQVISVEGLQELTNAIRDAIDRSHQIEEVLNP